VSRNRLTLGLCIGILAIAFESLAVATAMPAAAQDLDRVTWYAWAFSAFQVGMLFSSVLAGRLSDRIGPVRPLIGGMIVFAIGLVVAGSAGSMEQLIIGRLIQGLGGGAQNVALYVLVSRVFSETERPRVFSWISTAWVLPAFVGPPIAAFLTEQLSWHWVFFAVLPMIAATALLAVPTMLQLRRDGLDTGHAESSPVPIWAAVLVAAGVPLVQVAGQLLSLWSIPLLVAAIAVFAIALPRALSPGFFHRGQGPDAVALRYVILSRGLMAGSYFAAESFIPLSLVEMRGMKLFWAGAILTLGSIGWTSGAWIQSRLGRSVRRDLIIVAGLGCVSIGVGLAALVARVPGVPVGVMIAAWIIGGFGMGLAVASQSIATMRLSPPEAQGRNASSLQLGEALANSVLVAVAGSIFAALHPGGNLPLTFGTVLGFTVLTALFGVFLATRIGPVTDTDR
jgi:MFS family permease